jgi:DNA invertase Pin-like site-specific DNA recombinase
VAALNATGARKVFREVASGARTNRTQLSRAVAALGTGDVLMVTRLDRLARSTRDLLNTPASAPWPTRGQIRRHRMGGSC